MSEVYATFRTPSGHLIRVPSGGVIGRSESAALCLTAPDISEAHALLSLRDGRLKLLPLRGAVRFAGEPVAELILERGQRLQLSATVTLTVEELSLPPGPVGIQDTESSALTITLREESARLRRSAPGEPELLIAGKAARILYELDQFGEMAPWKVVAGEIWRDAKAQLSLPPHKQDDAVWRLIRDRWDKALKELRDDLRSAGIRESLILQDGRGNYQLYLQPTDQRG